MRSLPLLCVSLTLCACGAAPTPKAPAPAAAPAPEAVEPGPFAADATLRWRADGAALRVAGRWVLTPADGLMVPQGDTPPGALRFSSLRGREAMLADGVITLDGERLPVPSWFEGRPVAELSMTALFIDEDRIYVHQVDPEAGEATCRVRALAETEWRLPSGGCIEGGFLQVDALVRGPGPMVGVLSSGEGVGDSTVVYFDPRKGQGPVPGPTWASVGPVQMNLTAQGGTAWIVTAQPPGAATAGPTPHLYRWDLMDGKTEDLGAVPPGASPSPDGTLAWIENGAVCLRAPGAARRCFRP